MLESKKNNDTSLNKMAKDALHDLMHFDFKLFKSLAPLLFKPGFLTEKTFEGEGDRYVKPFTLFVFLNFLFFIVKSKGLFKFTLDSYADSPALVVFMTKTRAEFHIPLATLTERFNTAMHFEQKEYLVIMVPIFALVIGLLHIFKKRNYAEHLVFALYFYSFFIVYLIVLPLVMTAMQWLLQKLDMPGNLLSSERALIIFIFVVIFIYLFFALRRVYKETVWISIVKSSVLSLTAIILIAFVYRIALFYIVMHSIAD